MAQKYTYGAPGQDEGSITKGRLATEILAQVSDLSGYSFDAQMYGALAELLANGGVDGVLRTPTVFINETSNANQTYGLTINQADARDQELTLKSDITTGLTTAVIEEVETDDHYTISVAHGTNGGTRWQSMAKDAAVTNIHQLSLYGGTATTGKSTSSRGLYEILIAEHDGANALANVTADGNILSIRAYVGGAYSTTWVLDEDGDTWQSGNLAAVGAAFSGVLTAATVTALDDTGTPTVAAGNLFKTGGTTAITDFDDGVVGQRIEVLAAHTITITDGAAVDLAGGANYSMTATDTLTLQMFDDQVWVEMGRSVNGG